MIKTLAIVFFLGLLLAGIIVGLIMLWPEEGLSTEIQSVTTSTPPPWPTLTPSPNDTPVPPPTPTPVPWPTPQSWGQSAPGAGISQPTLTVVQNGHLWPSEQGPLASIGFLVLAFFTIWPVFWILHPYLIRKNVSHTLTVETQVTTRNQQDVNAKATVNWVEDFRGDGPTRFKNLPGDTPEEKIASADTLVANAAAKWIANVVALFNDYEVTRKAIQADIKQKKYGWEKLVPGNGILVTGISILPPDLPHQREQMRLATAQATVDGKNKALELIAYAAERKKTVDEVLDEFTRIKMIEAMAKGGSAVDYVELNNGLRAVGVISQKLTELVNLLDQKG